MLFFWTCLPKICCNARNTKGESVGGGGVCAPSPPLKLSTISKSTARWMLAPAPCCLARQWPTLSCTSGVPTRGPTDLLGLLQPEREAGGTSWGGWRVGGGGDSRASWVSVEGSPSLISLTLRSSIGSLLCWASGEGPYHREASWSSHVES